MTSKHDWDEQTPPERPASLRVLENTALEAKRSHKRIDSLEEGFGQVLREISAVESRTANKFEVLDRRITAGFERLGEIVDDLARVRRRGEESHHDLSEKLARTQRIATMKSISLPTAIVVSVVILCYTALLALHVDVPHWMMAAIGVIGSAVAGFLPGLLGVKAEDKP